MRVRVRRVRACVGACVGACGVRAPTHAARPPKSAKGPAIAGPFGIQSCSDGQPTIAFRAFIGRTLIFRVAGFAFTVIISPGLKGFGFS